MTQSRSLGIGVQLPNSGPFASAESITEIATTAERLRFDRVWVHDHISWAQERLTHFAAGAYEACADQNPNFFESITTLAVIAGRCPQIGVGIAGLVLPLREPRALAKQLATIDHLTDSRLVVAVAIGNVPNDFDVVGVRFDRRGRLTDDNLGALRAIFGAEQPLAYTSRSVSFENGTFYPRPRNLPIWITGSSDAALERTARSGDGWLTAYIAPTEYKNLVARLGTQLHASGRDATTVATAYETFLCVARTREEAVERSRATLVEKFKTLERGLEVAIVGDPAGVAARIHDYREAGARHFVFKIISRHPAEMAEMLHLLATA